MWKAACAVAGAAILAGCATADGADGPPAASARARPVGAPVNCIQTTLIDDTAVLDDRVIEFRLRNGRVFRNALDNSCPMLGSARAFSYRSTGSQLCAIDTITVLNPGGGVPGPICGLSEFQEVRYGD